MPIPKEKREPVSDIDIAVVDSLKVLDPNRPIREATKATGERSYSACRCQEETHAGQQYLGHATLLAVDMRVFMQNDIQ